MYNTSYIIHNTQYNPNPPRLHPSLPFSLLSGQLLAEKPRLLVLHHHPHSPPGSFLCSCPAPGYLCSPVAAVPRFSSLHHPLRFLSTLPLQLFLQAVTAAVSPGTYRSIASHGPTKPEGNHSTLLIGTGAVVAHRLLPAGQRFGERRKRWLCSFWGRVSALGDARHRGHKHSRSGLWVICPGCFWRAKI